jgi:hypothetical protein
VGRLTRNVVVQGDDVSSRRQQFGVQIVLSSAGDESLIGRLSNVEARGGTAHAAGFLRYSAHARAGARHRRAGARRHR